MRGERGERGAKVDDEPEARRPGVTRAAAGLQLVPSRTVYVTGPNRV